MHTQKLPLILLVIYMGYSSKMHLTMANVWIEHAVCSCYCIASQF